MGFSVARLPRPYDYRALIETYVYTKRGNFVHPDFHAYCAGLLAALEPMFGIRLTRKGLSSTGGMFWSLFENTVSSQLRITTPWDGYLETGLLDMRLAATGEPGRIVERAGATIHKAAQASEAAHCEMLHALFVAIFGECERVVTSEELREAGFDDSREPDITDYYDYM